MSTLLILEKWTYINFTIRRSLFCLYLLLLLLLIFIRVFRVVYTIFWSIPKLISFLKSLFVKKGTFFRNRDRNNKSVNLLLQTLVVAHHYLHYLLQDHLLPELYPVLCSVAPDHLESSSSNHNRIKNQCYEKKKKKKKKKTQTKTTKEKKTKGKKKKRGVI